MEPSAVSDHLNVRCVRVLGGQSASPSQFLGETKQQHLKVALRKTCVGACWLP